jgi:methanogenic corrinoid protein MtbC1
MIRWCSYCQSFIGEVDPFDDFGITHGACEACRANSAHRNGSLSSSYDSLSEIKDFFYKLQDRALKGKSIHVRRTVELAKALSISPKDTLIGIIRPLLAQLGYMYSVGDVSIASEHRFSEFSQRLITEIQNQYELHEPDRGDVLLVCAEGNYHSLGLKMLSMLLNDAGVATVSFTPGLPKEEIVELARSLNPQILGLSLATNEQILFAKSVSRALHDLNIPCSHRLAIGGNIMKSPEVKKNLNAWFICDPYSIEETICVFKKALLEDSIKSA